MAYQLSRRRFFKHVAMTNLGAGLASLAAVAAGQVSDDSVRGLTFLFQGDSITDGNRGRNTDPNHIMGHGYAFSIASRIGADFPRSKFNFFNRGVSGNKIPDLQKRWQSDTLEIKPDVLSILIGINDTGAAVKKASDACTVAEFETGYSKLLADCKSANPHILFILGLPFVCPVGPVLSNWEAWRDGVRQRAEVVRKLAMKFDAVLVDYQAVFDKAAGQAPPEYWVWDGIHPTVPGHELMAREWIEQAGKRLPFLRKK
ncbi:MAG: SGNH/GDSL hydrolase family protein [Massilia sp.]